MYKLVLLLLSIEIVYCENKYSKEANVKQYFIEEPEIQVRDIDKPFRIAKLNLLWSKAKLRLSEPKLKSLYSDLKLHDKQEITLKHFLVTGGSDKDGLKQADMRKRLIGIMSTYGLLEHFEDLDDKIKLKDFDIHPENFNKEVFKDKKLNKLWIKAEMAGFNRIELQVLKEEFSHHQDKIDEFYSVLQNTDGNTDENSVDEDLDSFNTISEQPIDFKYDNSRADILRNKSREIKDGYDRLERLAAQGPNSKDFVEPKVQALWRMAVNGNFTQNELDSLRVELHHYEKRLQKLRNLHLEVAVGKHQKDGKEKPSSDIDDMIKQHARKAEKLHNSIESKIVSRNEL